MNNNSLNSFMQSMLDSHTQIMEAVAQHRDKISEAKSLMVHSHLDASIERLKRFHDHVSSNNSELKSDILAATLKNAIDHHQHIKDRLVTHTHHSNTHKQTLRRLAMGAMAAFGVMSGVKAAPAIGYEESSSTPNPEASSVNVTAKSAKELNRQLLVDANAARLTEPAKAVELFRLIGNSPHATPLQLRSVAAGLIELGPHHYDAATQFLEQSTNPSKNPTKDDVSYAQIELNKLNELKKHIQPEKKSTVLKAQPGLVTQQIDFLLNLAIRLSSVDPVEAAESFIEIGTKEDITPQQLSTAARGLIELGSQYYDTAAKFFNQSLDPSKKPTEVDIIAAKDGLEKLERLYKKDAAKIARLVKKEESAPKTIPALESVNDAKPTPSTDLATSASTNLMSAAMKLIKEGGSENKSMAVELIVQFAKSEGVTSQDLLLEADKLRMLDPEHNDITAKVLELAADPKKNPNRKDIINAANGFKLLGSDYRPRAFELYLKLANIDGGLPANMRLAAESISKLDGAGYLTIALDLFNRAVDDKKNPTPEDIKLAAEGLSKLNGEEAKSAAIDLYHRLVSFPDPKFSRYAAEGLSKLGAKYNDGVVFFYNASAGPNKNPTSKDIQLAAEAVLKLGSKYADDFLVLCLNLSQHTSATAEDIAWVFNQMNQLGAKYNGKKARIYLSLAEHKATTPDYTLLAVSKISDFGATGGYKEAADLLTKKFIETPLYKLTPDNIKAAINQLEKFRAKYVDGTVQESVVTIDENIVDLCHRIRNHELAAAQDTMWAASVLLKIGNKAQAASLYKSIAKKSNSTSGEIIGAVNSLIELDNADDIHSEIAGYIDSSLDPTKKPTKQDYLAAILSFINLGNIFPLRSSERLQYSQRVAELQEKIATFK